MEAVRGYYDGTSFVPVRPVTARKNQRVIITLLDENDLESDIESVAGIDGLLSLLDEAEQDFKSGHIVSFPETIDDLIAKYE